jgi:Spy/CpxP family protein refolding chaperone
MTHLLGLTPQQQTKIKSILDASQKQINEVLSAEQRSLMQKLREQNGSVHGSQALDR